MRQKMKGFEAVVMEPVNRPLAYPLSALHVHHGTTLAATAGATVGRVDRRPRLYVPLGVCRWTPLSHCASDGRLVWLGRQWPRLLSACSLIWPSQSRLDSATRNFCNHTPNPGHSNRHEKCVLCNRFCPAVCQPPSHSVSFSLSPCLPLSTTHKIRVYMNVSCMQIVSSPPLYIINA